MTSKKIKPTQWIVIDEISMLTTKLLTLTSQVSGFIKTGNGAVDSTIPFGD